MAYEFTSNAKLIWTVSDEGKVTKVVVLIGLDEPEPEDKDIPDAVVDAVRETSFYFPALAEMPEGVEFQS